MKIKGLTKMNLLKVAFLSSILLITGCANPFAVMRDANRVAINKIDVGMSKTQVQNIMGNISAQHPSVGKWENPYKREIVSGTNGNSYEVLYYYTQEIGDYQPIESGLTPVVFKNGNVVGIGWGYLDSVSGNSTTTIRRR